MQLADPLEVLRQFPPETMIYGRASYDGGPMETCLYIKEDMRYIKKIKYNPYFSLRTAMYEQGGVALVVVMVQPNGDDDMIYESWWNYHQTGGGEKYFRDIMSQDRIVIHFIDAATGEIALSKQVKNSLKNAFIGMMSRLMDWPQWTMGDFDAARDTVYKKYRRPSCRGVD